MNFKEAKKIALNRITRNGSILKENPPIIIDESIIEYTWGWLLYYDSALYINQGQSECGYIGNAPILIDKIDGSTHFIGLSLKGVEEIVQNYFIKKGYKNSIEEVLLDSEE